MTNEEIKTVEDLARKITNDIVDDLLLLAGEGFDREDMVEKARMSPSQITDENSFDDYIAELSYSLEPLTLRLIQIEGKEEELNDVEGRNGRSNALYIISVPIYNKLIGHNFSIESEEVDPDRTESKKIVIRWKERFFSCRYRESSWSDYYIRADDPVEEVEPRRVEIIQFFPKSK